jgi:hypothetical protein
MGYAPSGCSSQRLAAGDLFREKQIETKRKSLKWVSFWKWMG